MRRRRKRALDEAIAAYAAAEAGGPADLDPDLEQAGVDVLSDDEVER